MLQAHVRLWHKADTLNALTNVRFLRESGHELKGSFISANDPKRTSGCSIARRRARRSLFR